MRFLFVNQHASAPAFGNPYRSYYLARGLVRAGHEVTIVAASFSHQRQSQPQMAGKPTWTNIDGIDYCFVPVAEHAMGALARVRNMFGFLFSLRRHWKEIADRAAPDVVVEATTHYLSIHATRKIARRRGAKLVLEMRDAWPQTLVELTGVSPWHPLVLLVRHALATTIRVSDGVVSTLSGADRYLIEQNLAPRAFAHVQNGVELSAFEPTQPVDTEQARAVAALRERYSAVVGYAGSMGRANAVDVLVDAAPALDARNVAIVLIGQGEKKAELEARAQAEGLDNVYIFDAVPKADVLASIRAFDLGFVGGRVRAIHRFGVSPNKLFDYMAAAVPVLFCIASPDRIVETARCGFELHDPNPARIVETVEAFLALPPAERTAMGARGCDYVREHFSFDVLAQEFVAAVTAMGAKS